VCEELGWIHDALAGGGLLCYRDRGRDGRAVGF
jgi:hypothetical protein